MVTNQSGDNGTSLHAHVISSCSVGVRLSNVDQALSLCLQNIRRTDMHYNMGDIVAKDLLVNCEQVCTHSLHV